MRRFNGGAQFTLVELLVVIAITAMLVSMLLPALNNARNFAYKAKCASNLKQLGVLSSGYSADYKYYPPTFLQVGISGNPSAQF